MAWSENYKYKNPDITEIADKVSRIMGIDSGAAGRRSRTMSDILTGAKTEGQQLKNTQQDILVKAIQAAVGQSGLDDDGRLLRAATTSSTDIGGGLSKEAMLASQLAEQEGKAQLQKQAVDKGNLIASLAKRLEVGGSPEHAKRVMTMPQGLPGSNVTVPARGYSEGDQERWARLIRTLQGGQVGTDMDFSGAKGLREIQNIEKKGDSFVSYNKARESAVQALTEPRVKEIEARTKKILSDLGINSDIGTAKINKINQAALDAALIAQQKGFNLKDTNALINERILTEGQRLKKEGHLASKAGKEDDATGGKLYRSKRKEEEELETVKTKKETAQSKANIASQDEKVHPQRLKDLQTQRTNVIEKGKVLLKNAKTEGKRKRLALEIDKELRPIEIRIKELAAEQADVNIRSKSRESLTRTQSPSEKAVEKLLQLSKIDKKNSSSSWDDAGKTATTTATSQKGTGKDPIAMDIFKSLMTTVKPEVLKSWTPEETDNAVAMIKQKHPDMNEERIRRLIQTAQRRSQ